MKNFTPKKANACRASIFGNSEDAKQSISAFAEMPAKNATPEKAMAPTVSAVGAIRKKQKQLQFSSKSTAMEAQRARIVQALRRRPQTSYDLRRLGCYQAPARIKELRDRDGYLIETERITLVDRDGYTHPNAALYTLVGEPG